MVTLGTIGTVVGGMGEFARADTVGEFRSVGHAGGASRLGYADATRAGLQYGADRFLGSWD